MSHATLESEQQRERLAALLAEEAPSLAAAWLADDGCRAEALASPARAALRAQAVRFLELLARGLREPYAAALTPETEAALQHEFPRLYGVRALLALAGVVSARLREQQAPPLSAAHFIDIIEYGLANCPVPATPSALFSEGLARLNRLSDTLCGSHDRDAILATALTEATALVGAQDSAIWLWDTDQQAPIMLVTAEGARTGLPDSPSLLALLRQASQSGGAFSVDAGESDEGWPPALAARPLAFIPLTGERGCVGVLTVHHAVEGHFSHDDILLLSSLGNLVATTLRAAQLYATERHLVNLLQTSIRQVMRATTGGLEQAAEFVHSLLQVAEGLTRADAVCAVLHIEGERAPVRAASGALASRCPDGLHALADALQAQPDTAPAGLMRDTVPAAICPEACDAHYALAPITLSGRPAGVLYALQSAAPFTESQTTFLRTIAEQIGVGIQHKLQSANVQRLLFQLSNVNYVSSQITGTLDPERVLAIVSAEAHKALHVPIVLCGWFDDDGTIRVFPDTAVGVPPEALPALRLTSNNAVIRRVLREGVDVTSRSVGLGGRLAFPTLAHMHVTDWACIPMVVKGRVPDAPESRVRGIMLVADTQPREFAVREIALLATYANQAALAVENSLLYRQVDHQLQQMELLYGVTSSASSAQDVQERFRVVLQASARALRTTAALLCLAEEGSGVQTIADAVGIAEEEVGEMRFAPGAEIIGMAWQRGAAITSTNLARDGRSPALRDLARRAGLVSSLTVPMLLQGRSLGTLTVIAREAREFTEADERLLQAIATEAAVAVRNARALAQERAQGQALRARVQELSQHVTTTLGMIEDLLRIAEETESREVALTRTRLRLEAVTAVQAVMTTEGDATVDVKGAVRRLMNERALRLPAGATHPDIRVTGARLYLPSEVAIPLVLFIHEWVAEPITATPPAMPGPQLVIDFVKSGRDIHVRIELPAALPSGHTPPNSAIIEATARSLQGTVLETVETGRRLVRLHFARPADDSAEPSSGPAGHHE